MTKIIESTADQFPAQLAAAGVPGDAVVVARVYTPAEADELKRLQKLVDEGLARGGATDAEIVRDRLSAKLSSKLSTAPAK